MYTSPRAQAGHHPHSTCGQMSLLSPLGLGLPSPLCSHGSSSRRNRAFWENPYDSGNDNGRRNRARLQAELRRGKQQGMHRRIVPRPGLGGTRPIRFPFPFPIPHQGGLHSSLRSPRRSAFSALGGRGLLGAMPSHHYSTLNRNPFAMTRYGMNTRGLALPLPRRGLPPHPFAQRHPCATPFHEDDECYEDEDYDEPYQNRHRGWDGYDDLEDEDDEEDFYSLPSRSHARYDIDPYERYYDDYSQDEDDIDGMSSFSMDTRYDRYPPPYQSYGRRY